MGKETEANEQNQETDFVHCGTELKPIRQHPREWIEDKGLNRMRNLSNVPDSVEMCKYLVR